MAQLSPPSFQFSQHSLQDFADCPRRFQLRYVLRQRWPAVPSEPVEEQERYAEQGRRFHRLVYSHQVGLPVDTLTATVNDVDDPDLVRWWQGYLESPPAGLPPGARYAEFELMTTLAGHRLRALYDLVAVGDGRAVIVDWKTGRKRPKYETLARRLQTIVYRTVLVEAGAALLGDGGSIAPEQVSMVYWFANDPASPVRLPYNADHYQRDREHLSAMMAEIVHLAETMPPEEVRRGGPGVHSYPARAWSEGGVRSYPARRPTWPMGTDERSCRFCIYRSLCRPGLEAGPVEEEEFEDDFALDFGVTLSEVEEIAY